MHVHVHAFCAFGTFGDFFFIVVRNATRFCNVRSDLLRNDVSVQTELKFARISLWCRANVRNACVAGALRTRFAFHIEIMLKSVHVTTCPTLLNGGETIFVVQLYDPRRSEGGRLGEGKGEIRGAERGGSNWGKQRRGEL